MPELTPERQLDLWVEGNPQCPNTRGECCPDFSCCVSKMLAPLEMRIMFRDEPARREAMLFGFLGTAIPNEFGEKEVYVAGKPEPDWEVPHD